MCTLIVKYNIKYKIQYKFVTYFNINIKYNMNL